MPSMRRQLHDLTHTHLLSCDMGDIIPTACVEVLPGDSFQHSASMLIRVTPQLKPIMHRVTAQVHHFFVPNRVIWSGWEDFITGINAAAPPTLSGAAHTSGKLYDYLGIYNDASNGFSALPLRAYNMIYNEYYRDKDLESVEIGEDQTDIQKAQWEKDYLTAARPWPQKGTAVTVPIGTSAPITGIGVHQSATYAVTNPVVDETDGSGTETYAGATSSLSTGNEQFYIEEDPSNAGYPNIRADLSSATGLDIREFREALALQRYQEARARYGSSYVDYLRYLGVNPSDSRLQRPEYLAGGRQTLAFSEVIQTNYNSDDTSGTGDLKGHGIGALRSNRYRRFFNEHGWLISMLVVRPQAMYVNGLPRKFWKVDKEDYWQRELQHVGHQEVYNREVWAGHTNPGGTFGYAPRYAEYMSEQNRVSAEFRDSTNWDWHFGRVFTTDPTLNAAFVECNPTKRTFADQTNHSLWVMVKHDLRARRLVQRSDVGRVI